MAGVTFHPVPAHLMGPKRGVEPLPQIDVFHWALVGGAPAVALPVVDPTHDAIAQVLAVGVDVDRTRPLERLQRRDRRHQLHAIVGGMLFPAHQLFRLIAERENRAPAAGTGITRAGAVGMDRDALLRHALSLRMILSENPVSTFRD